jgi:hypothetical protein
MLTEGNNLDMNSDIKFAQDFGKSTALSGLRISGGLLIVYGFLFGFLVASFVLLTFVASLRARRGEILSPANFRLSATVIVILVIMSAFTWLCVRAGKALYAEQRWGAYVAMSFGLLLLLFSGDFIYDLYRAVPVSSDEGFLVLVLPMTLLLGLWWCIYLNLPHVRARLAIAAHARPEMSRSR